MRREIKRLADLESLENGAVGELFRKMLAQVMNDVADRAALDKARSIAVQVDVSPVADDRGELSDLNVVVQLKCTVPKSATRTVSMSWAAKKGALVWNDLSPDDVHQKTIDE